MQLGGHDSSRSDIAFSLSTGQEPSVLQNVSPPQGAKIAAALWSGEEVDQRIRGIVAKAIDHPHSPELKGYAIGLEEILAVGSESEQESAKVLRDVISWMEHGDSVFLQLDRIDDEMYTITDELHSELKGVSQQALRAAPKIQEEINKLRQLSLDQLSPPLRKELEKRIQVRIQCCEQILEDWGESVAHAVDKAFRYQDRYGKDNDHVKTYLRYLRHVVGDKDERLRSLPDEGPVEVEAVKKAIQALKQLDRESRSWWSSCWRSVTKPEEWSDRTKNTVKNLFVAAQLSQRVVTEVEHVQTTVQALPIRAQELQQRAIAAVPKEEKEAIQREAAHVATLLSDRFDAMKDPETRQVLTHRLTPEGRQFVTQVVEQNGSLRPDQARALASEFELRALIRHSPEANPYTQRMQRLQTGINMLVGGPPDLTEQTSRAVQLLSDGQAMLKDLEAMPTGPPKAEIEALRQEVLLLGVALARTANAPDTPCPPSSMQQWCEEVQQQCFAVKEVVGQINDLMAQAREHMPQPESDAELSLAGNKHANLIKMARVAETLQVPGVSVPRPRGIDGPVVQAHLDMYAPNVVKRWQRLEQLFKTYSGQGPFLESPQAKKELEAMQKEVESAFRSHPLPLSKEMTSWLKELEASGNYLMVRSSGAEDSRKLANAGGNVSVSYVAPNSEAVSAALGQVIVSYFGYSSLQNRINAGSNPFTEPMSLGSTVQELVGEQVGGSSDPAQIPISLVLFTNEPLFVGTEEFRVMRISASYGHGDGVVGNLGVNTDTALILHSVAHPDELYILYDNQVKPERLAPVRDDKGHISLQRVMNPEEMQMRPALSEAMIRRLFQWGIIGESYFEGHPTDMEIVVKADTIYPVQARPVNRPQILPTYLDTKKVTAAADSPLVSTVSSDVVVPGKASVVEITSADQVLTAKTLLEAEQKYDKAKHKLVVITEPEPANSHPVVNFSALGQPCVLVKDQASVQQMLSRLDAHHALAVCMQEGTINLWDTRKGSIEAFTSPGFTVHPAKLAVSVPVTEMLPQVNAEASRQKVPQEVTDLLLSIRSAATTEVAREHLQALSTHSWVTQLRARQQALQTEPLGGAFNANVVQSAAELDLRIQRAFSEAEQAFVSIPVEHRLERLMHVKVLETLLLAPPGSHAAVGQVSLVTMLPLLEDLEEVVSYTKSLDRVPQFAGELRLARYAPLVEVEKEWRAFLREAEQVASPSEAAAFRQLLQQLEEMGIFGDWLISVFYIARIKDPAAVRDFIVTACSSLPPSGIRMMYALRQHQAAFRELHDHLDRFGDPQAFQSALELLVREFTQLAPNRPIGGSEVKRQEVKEFLDAAPKQHPKIDYVIGLLKDAIWGKQSESLSESLFDEWEQAGPLARVMFAQTLYQLVDLADQAIKTMKMSPHFSEHKKLEQFKKMVFSLHDFFTTWMSHIRHHEGGLIKGSPRWGPGSYTYVSWTKFNNEKLSFYDPGSDETIIGKRGSAPLVTRYERDEWWKEVRKRNDPDTQLRSSSNFCVSGAVIGNRDVYGSFYRLPPIPWTLEDLFTLAHQNLLQITAHLAQQERPDMLATLIQGNPSSDMLVRLCDLNGMVDLLVAGNWKMRVNFSLLDVMGSGDGMRFRVRSQLRDHGVLYELHCDREFKNWSVKTTVFAEEEKGRLALMEAELGRVQGEVVDRVKLSKITKMTSGVSYELELKEPDHLQDAIRLATFIGWVEEMLKDKTRIASETLFR